MEDVCVDCSQDNGINSGKNCKFCNERLCKNSWKLELKTMSKLVISTTNQYNCFNKFLVNDKYSVGGKQGFMYDFPFNKIYIDFEKEVIMLKISNLEKPLIIRFESIMKYNLKKHKNNNHHMLTIYLKNMLVMSIGYNEYNSKIFKIFSKWVESFNILIN